MLVCGFGVLIRLQKHGDHVVNRQLVPLRRFRLQLGNPRSNLKIP